MHCIKYVDIFFLLHTKWQAFLIFQVLCKCSPAFELFNKVSVWRDGCASKRIQNSSKHLHTQRWIKYNCMKWKRSGWETERERKRIKHFTIDWWLYLFFVCMELGRTVRYSTWIEHFDLSTFFTSNKNGMARWISMCWGLLNVALEYWTRYGRRSVEMVNWIFS